MQRRKGLPSRRRVRRASPTAYEHEPDAMDFPRAVPAVWDETRALDGRVGEFVLLARRDATGTGVR